MYPAPGKDSVALLVPENRIAPKRTSLGWEVVGVSPEFGAALLPLAEWIWSSGLTGTRPVNSFAVASCRLPLLGKFTVIVSELVNAITLWAEQIVSRGEVEVAGMSTSIP